MAATDDWDSELTIGSRRSIASWSSERIRQPCLERDEVGVRERVPRDVMELHPRSEHGTSRERRRDPESEIESEIVLAIRSHDGGGGWDEFLDVLAQMIEPD